jgi:hypothetical protein
LVFILKEMETTGGFKEQEWNDDFMLKEDVDGS